MKRLFLLRHAKSSWENEHLADHDRPLAPRGRKAADRIGRYLRSEGIKPSLVLCSSARRTRETLERVRADGEVMIEPELYGTSESELLERLRRVLADTVSVMLIGHNPGIQDLALELAGHGHRLDDLRHKFPTAALATLTLRGGWSDLEPGSAELVGFVKPKELA
ncbi:MAG: histidine phosphatase family protein [Thermoleophilaceae bacterium]|nr:histidine phosphatase family protein [Thermoleophilaceae bacterium]